MRNKSGCDKLVSAHGGMIDYPVSNKLWVRSNAACQWWSYSPVTAGYILARSVGVTLKAKSCHVLRGSGKQKGFERTQGDLM